jgi:hypothetical protein
LVVSGLAALRIVVALVAAVLTAFCVVATFVAFVAAVAVALAQRKYYGHRRKDK